jgi:hypothetical protein
METMKDYEIVHKAMELRRLGRDEEAVALMLKIPLAPPIAKAIKKLQGLDVLLSTGWDLSEVEARYGKEFLTH